MDKDMYIGLLEDRITKLGEDKEIIKELKKQIEELTHNLFIQDDDLKRLRIKIKELGTPKTPAEKYCQEKEKKNSLGFTSMTNGEFPPHGGKGKKKKKRTESNVDWVYAKKQIKNLLFTLGELTTRQIAQEMALDYKAVHYRLHQWANVGDVLITRRPQHGKKTMTVHWKHPKLDEMNDNVKGINRADD